LADDVALLGFGKLVAALVGRRELASSPTGYGWLLTLMGLGAVTGA
jgi:hypothetical protein